ncbi:peptidase inhibitor family I36 protein [uncultured Methylobacterium sp.]|uniref:peptidase inhibitor family I36 protein n=1 Tax=uncultured Methylobacterium sp. TaxID=157278 RepID=UPI0035CB2427
MAMAMGLDAIPAGTGGGEGRDGSKRWIALFLALAAGWGTLFGYSAVFLSEDMPFRPASGAQADPVVGFPRLAPPPASAPAGGQPAPHDPDPPPVATRRAAADATGAPQGSATVPAPAALNAPATAPPASAPAVPAPRAERADYVGTWGPNEAACGARSRRRGYIPAIITPERASAGRTICNFRDGRRSGKGWVMAADCSDRGHRWSSQVRLVVDGDRLTWTSGKGISAYVRCGRRAG